MPEYARVCQSMPEYARVCQGMPEYARVCQSMPERYGSHGYGHAGYGGYGHGGYGKFGYGGLGYGGYGGLGYGGYGGYGYKHYAPSFDYYAPEHYHRVSLWNLAYKNHAFKNAYLGNLYHKKHHDEVPDVVN